MNAEEWRKENTTRICLRLMNSSGIPAALQRMTEETGMKASAYIRRSLENELIRDGYLSYSDLPQRPQHKND